VMDLYCIIAYIRFIMLFCFGSLRIYCFDSICVSGFLCACVFVSSD
jgi:hypothetical protein